MNPVSNRRIGIPSLVALLLAVLWALTGYRAYTERERVIAAKEVELNKLVIAVEGTDAATVPSHRGNPDRHQSLDRGSSGRLSGAAPGFHRPGG
jgi:hypothetical protein